MPCSSTPSTSLLLRAALLSGGVMAGGRKREDVKIAAAARCTSRVHEQPPHRHRDISLACESSCPPTFSAEMPRRVMYELAEGDADAAGRVAMWYVL